MVLPHGGGSGGAAQICGEQRQLPHPNKGNAQKAREQAVAPQEDWASEGS